MNPWLVGLCCSIALVAACKSKATHNGSTVGSEIGSGSGIRELAVGTGLAVRVGSGSAAAPMPDSKVVARGQYLSNLLGCPYCHMPVGPTGPDFSRPYAGGLEVHETFGTWRAPNITPHKGSGIGTWSDEQIIAAIREGVRPDASHLYPIMPYLSFNRLTDDDAKALVTFLRTVAPIDNVVAPTRNLRLPQLLTTKPSNLPDAVDNSIKHGEYLVTLMHCTVCHTPFNKDGAPDMSRAYAGGSEMEVPTLGTGKLYGANITSDPDTGIGKWSQADIANALKTMTRPDGTIIQGPMQFYLAGWSKIEDRDLVAIAAYVQAIPAIKNRVPTSTFKTAMPMGRPGVAGSGSSKSATN